MTPQAALSSGKALSLVTFLTRAQRETLFNSAAGQAFQQRSWSTLFNSEAGQAFQKRSWSKRLLSSTAT
ncbi:MAG: hypothetical protein LH470_03320 [Lysobacter sp.]|nr:hypothetical protein [Lysobacter sp.]